LCKGFYLGRALISLSISINLLSIFCGDSLVSKMLDILCCITNKFPFVLTWILFWLILWCSSDYRTDRHSHLIKISENRSRQSLRHDPNIRWEKWWLIDYHSTMYFDFPSHNPKVYRCMYIYIRNLMPPSSALYSQREFCLLQACSIFLSFHGHICTKPWVIYVGLS